MSLVFNAFCDPYDRKIIGEHPTNEEPSQLELVVILRLLLVPPCADVNTTLINVCSSLTSAAAAPMTDICTHC